MSPLIVEELDPAVRELMLSLGRQLRDAMPDGTGFALLVFAYGPGGAMSYLSSANREDMICALRELLGKLEGAGC